MGATDLVTDERFEAYKVQSSLFETVVLSESFFFVPQQNVCTLFLENLTFDDALKIESSLQSPDFVTNYEKWSLALSKYKSQLKSLKEQLNLLKNEIRQYAEGAVFNTLILKGASEKFHALGKTLL